MLELLFLVMIDKKFIDSISGRMNKKLGAKDRIISRNLATSVILGIPGLDVT